MKKVYLLLVAIVATSICLNAQSVKKFTATTDAIPVAGTIWSVDGCSMMFYDAPSAEGIKANTAVTFGGETFEFSLQGVNNPKPWTYPDYGGSAMWLFDCTKAGKLTIITAVNSKKNTYIVETPIVDNKDYSNYCYVLCGEAGVTDYVYTDELTFQAGAKFVTATIKVGDRLFNGARSWDIWDVVEGNSFTMTATEKTAADDAAYAISNWIYDAVTIKAEAGKCYNYFCTGSKACIYGFVFTPDAVVDPVAVKNINSSATIVKTEYFNLLGAKLPEPAYGVNIIRKTMSDGSIVTTKTVINK